MKNKNVILVVINEPENLAEILQFLESDGSRIVQAKNGGEGKLKYSNEEFNQVIIDYDVRDMNCKDFVESIRRKENLRHVKDRTPVLVLGREAGKYQADLGQVDACKFLEKPFTISHFRKAMVNLLGNKDVISENTRIIEDGEYLINEGESSKEMYWVLSGKFVITKLNDDDQNIVIGEVLPGELVGEMSFLDNQLRSASVRATEESEVLSIPHKKFIDVLDGQPRWFRSLMRTLSQRLRGANKIIARKTADIDALESVAKDIDGLDSSND